MSSPRQRASRPAGPPSVACLKAARALIGVSQGELAQTSGVSIGAIGRIERYAADRPLPCKVRTWTLLVGALESAGVAFIEENGGGPGVRLRKRRAS